MASKKGTTRKSSTSKAKKTKIEKIEKKQTIQSKTDKRKKNGGARPGAGRKPSAELERINRLKDEAEQHALQEIDAPVYDADGKKTKKTIKMARSVALLDLLFTEGLTNRNIPAIKEYFDRTRGKARQPIEHSGEIKTEDQYIPDDPATKKAHEVYISERKKLIASGYYVEDGE